MSESQLTFGILLIVGVMFLFYIYNLEIKHSRNFRYLKIYMFAAIHIIILFFPFSLGEIETVEIENTNYEIVSKYNGLTTIEYSKNGILYNVEIETNKLTVKYNDSNKAYIKIYKYTNLFQLFLGDDLYEKFFGVEIEKICLQLPTSESIDTVDTLQ